MGSSDSTFRCNLNCRHCYVNLPANDRAVKRQELTYGEVCDIVDQVVDEGCLSVLFTGGEVFVRADFLAILKHPKEKGLMVSIFTNGTLITPHCGLPWRMETACRGDNAPRRKKGNV